MSFDGVFTRLMVLELTETLVRGRVSKIHQPYPNEIVLVLRSQGKNHKLLLSAHPSYARIQLTEMAYSQPETTPNFVMMLRKFLDGAILTAINQPENDRVVHFVFSKRNELGDLQERVLVVELMGRHSTILLLEKQTNKILDVIKHVGHSQNTYRSLLPGSTYLQPPQQDNVNPFSASKETVFELLSIAPRLDAAYLQQQFQGLGRDTAKELAFLLQQTPQEKMAVWTYFFDTLCQQPQPTLTKGTQKEFFTPFPFQTLTGEVVSFATLSALLDAFYAQKAEKDRVKQQGGELIRKIEQEYTKNINKKQKLEQTLAESDAAENDRRNGELLTTFILKVPKGATHVTLPNYYENDAPIQIPLDPALSPNQNAQKYFRKYKKLKNAAKVVQTLLAQTQQEILYLDSVRTQLALANPTDLATIKEELVAQGYIKKRRTAKKKAAPSQPETFLSSDGTPILVGKNNLQNDQLTLKLAKKTDYWLHAKDIPGSHVIVKSSAPSETTLIEAAKLAAFYSKYRLSAQVPVDYVQVKHVHKPNGAKPGYVIYEKQKTLFVTPHETEIQKLQSNKT